MKRIRFGREGPWVSPVALGTWQAGLSAWGSPPGALEGIKEGLGRAIDLGLNLFDTAEVYGLGRAERILGEALRGHEDAVVVSKIAGYRVTGPGILGAARKIASRLGRRPGVLLHHWPPPFHASPCGVARKMMRILDEGLAEYIGFSNYPLRMLQKVWECTGGNVQAIQHQYSLAFRQPELGIFEFARERGMAIMAWSPLAKGALAGKTVADNKARETDPVFNAASKDEDLRSALRSVAQDLGITMAQVAIAWVISKGAIPVVGFRKVEHVEQAAEAAEIKLPNWALKELDSLSQRYIHAWGREYRVLSRLRLIPSHLQSLAIRLMKGV